MGVHQLAALSTGEVVANPRHLQAGRRRLLNETRKLSRTRKGSKRRGKAAAAVGKTHHLIAERRATTLHQLTKRLATQWESIAVEDLNVSGMTRSARGTVDNPGRNVAAKSGLNRGILDAAPAELRRQLGYKTRWYGSQLVVIDRWYPSSQTCSQCAVRTKLALRQRVFRCAACGLVCDRDVNAAINLAAQAAVDPGTGQTLNARLSQPDPPPRGEPRSAPALTRADHPTRVATPTRQRVGHPNTRTHSGTLQLK
jgi:putative transposase